MHTDAARPHGSPRPAVVFAFAGQASQYPQMGRRLAASDLRFAAEWRRVRTRVWSDLPGGVDGRAVAAIPPTDVRSTYREIFAVQYALARTVIAAGTQPDAVLGVSTGEITAATVAGRLTEDDAVELLAAHAQALHRDCPAGGMVAVVGDASVLDGLEPEANCEVALASARHFVVGGDRAGLARLRRGLRERRAAGGGVSFVLPVERGFHSPAIDAVDAASVGGARFGRSNGVTFVSSLLAAANDGPLEPGHMWSAIRNRIRFVDAARTLQDRPLTWLDFGPGSSIATLLSHNRLVRAGETAQSLLAAAHAEHSAPSVGRF